MSLKQNLFNVNIAPNSNFPSDDHVAKDLAGRVVSVREDGLISLNKGEGLPIYAADLNKKSRSKYHLIFTGEQPIIQPKIFNLLERYFPRLSTITTRPLKTAKIEELITRGYRLFLQYITNNSILKSP